MRNGFTFKDIHSSVFGVSVRTKSRPLMPSAKTQSVSAAYRDGAYDFSEANPHGRMFYNDRSFKVSLGIYADTFSLMQKKLSKLSAWLCGHGELIFDDMSLVKWKARVSDEIIYMPEHEGRRAVIDVTFNAEPFADCVFDTNGPFIDAELELDNDIPLDIPAKFIYRLVREGEFIVVNIGDRPMRPVITLTGYTGIVSLSMGNELLSFDGQGDNVIVDFNRQCVMCEGTVIAVEGEFFEFDTGVNTLKIENSDAAAVTVEITYTPQFMYNAYFDDIDWGDSNA